MISLIKTAPTHRWLFLFSICAITLSGCYGGSSNEDESQENSVIPAVEAVEARYGSLPLSERLSGTVRAENQVMLSPEIQGRIAEVYVQDGDQVQRGDRLVKLAENQYREQYRQAEAGANIAKAQLKQSQAQLSQLERRFERIQRLRDKELSSEQEYETIRADVESARADVELAEAQLQQSQATMEEQQNLLSQTVIRAPINGTVGQRNAEVGMQVSTSTALFVIGNLQNVRIEVVLTDNMLGEISTGQPALIYADSAAPIRAEVSRISPFLNNTTRSTEAQIEVTNKQQQLKPGMFVPVDILYGNSRQATLIPSSALYTNPETGDEGVFVAPSIGLEVQPADSALPDSERPLTEPTQVAFQRVDVIARGRMEIAVTGIDSGSWVVTVGQNLLSQGRSQARVRTVGWKRILSMQQLQRQDLLDEAMQQPAPVDSPS